MDKRAVEATDKMRGGNGLHDSEGGECENETEKTRMVM